MRDDGPKPEAAEQAGSTGCRQTQFGVGADHGSADATISGSTQPDYELLRLIGRGGYGEVWLARDKAGIYRAVKIIFRESFEHDRPYEREYEGIRKFEPLSRSYDNQVQILHVGRHDDRRQFYYIMELADDQRACQEIDPAKYEPKTIKSELKRLGRFPAEECLRIGAALAVALENLHQNGLIHRDIKPGNIIFVSGVPKLADIGLVTDRDVTVSYVGTEGYIPPEGPGSTQADIYGLGKVLYEMSTGRDRLDYPELPTDLDERPDRKLFLELNVIIAKACARDPGKRYRTACNLFQDLVRAQQGKPARGDGLRRGLAITVWAGAAVAVVAMGVLGVRHYRKAPTTQDETAKNSRLSGPPQQSPSVSQAPLWASTAKPGTSVAPLRGTLRSGERWTNSLGMVFVPVPGTKVLFSIWETRVQDYAAFIKASGKNWQPASFEQGPTHPAVRVSWFDAGAFCDWLTVEEQRHRWLRLDQKYRLPLDEEWSSAVGLEHEEGGSPSGKNERIKDLYPWGPSWPPPARAGNYGRSGFVRTAPVASFAPNKNGIYDLGGNVWEWCEDAFEPGGTARVMRGASWYRDRPTFLLSSHRSDQPPQVTFHESVGFRVVLAGRGGAP
jgi:serine/threonine protein kinase